MVDFCRNTELKKCGDSTKSIVLDIIKYADNNENWEPTEAKKWSKKLTNAMIKESIAGNIYEVRLNFLHAPSTPQTEENGVSPVDYLELEDTFYDLHIYAPDHLEAIQIALAWSEDEIPTSDLRFYKTPLQPGEVSAQYKGDTEDVLVVCAELSRE